MSSRSRGTAGARPIQSKVQTDKAIWPKIEPDKEKQNEKYEDVLDKQKSSQASALSPQMLRVICWNVLGL